MRFRDLTCGERIATAAGPFLPVPVFDKRCSLVDFVPILRVLDLM